MRGFPRASSRRSATVAPPFFASGAVPYLEGVRHPLAIAATLLGYFLTSKKTIFWMAETACITEAASAHLENSAW
jgi:hypothetical protein